MKWVARTFHFHSDQCILKISSDPQIIYECICSLKMFTDFPVILLLLISSLSPLWSKNIFCMISVILNVFRFLNPQDMNYLGKGFVGTRKECIFCC